MDNNQKAKIADFVKKLKQIQPKHGRDIGLIVTAGENLADIQAAFPNPNSVSLYETTEDVDNIIKNILQDLKSEKDVLLKLSDWLDPSLYNQLYLISCSGRADYFLPEGSITFDIPKNSVLVLTIDSGDLERLNYKDFLNICGPVLRLDGGK